MCLRAEKKNDKNYQLQFEMCQNENCEFDSIQNKNKILTDLILYSTSDFVYVTQ